MKTLVLGMGNPILSDDGVGIVIANSLEGRFEGADVATSAMIGLDLLDMIEGYDRIYVIDAMCTRGGRIGEVHKVFKDGNDGTMHLFSSHGIHFFELMELGERCGLNMPEVGAVYGIEIGDCVCFDNSLSKEIQGKLTSITEEILDDLRSSSSIPPDHSG